ncbi:cGMP-dependent protein kinase 1-like isoform X2 [Euwallacea fornicatus]|uniref:cGMP-dependent protein kinase 1-like isoform X2 n=1 Tax=Euwallacea fornicatus TaxID=995702 RepID=UPI00339020DE
MPKHTPAPTPNRAVYGFSLFLSFNISFLLYLIWAIIPEKYFKHVGIDFLPQRHWAVAIPIYILTVLTLFAFFIYPSLGLMMTPDVDDMRTVTDQIGTRRKKNGLKLSLNAAREDQCVCKSRDKCWRDRYELGRNEASSETMTHKDLYKIQANLKGKTKQRRRSGILSPTVKSRPPLRQDSQRNGLVSKSTHDEAIIRKAVANNEFLKNILSEASLQTLIECMYVKTLVPEELLLKQGKINSHLFISKSGTFEIIENDKKVEIAKGVRVFGEVAVLYNAKAGQTVKAVSEAAVWALDCPAYKSLTTSQIIEKREEIVGYLEEVPSFSKASEWRLYNLCNLFQEKFYPGSATIIKEGQQVGSFLMVIKGSATVLGRERNKKLDKLTRGCFFGENVFSKEITSQYTIIADPPGADCLLLPKKKFLEHYVDLEEFLQDKGYIFPEIRKYESVELKNLQTIKTLGIGGFGRVELVHDIKHRHVYALKLMKKHEIHGKAQIEQVFNEKDLQMMCDSPFIVKLYKTFRDTKYIYFLLEPCLGGDLWNLLRRQRKKCFDTEAAKFYSGCIVEALSYLHLKDIVYRDLKPENVMVRPNNASYSFVGTAEYIAPELIRKAPHDKGVDYWALGVFIFELLVGKSPFRNDEHNDLKTYQAILKGIDFVTFPSVVSPRARNLIKKLCKPRSVDRIGCQINGIKDIQQHPWFSKLEWDKLRTQKLEPPIRISLIGRTDTRYFENFDEDREQVVDDYSAWDEDF